MASCALRLLREGHFTEAAACACLAAQGIKGEGFFESNTLAAIALEKAGDHKASLDYWDKLVISAPHKLKYLEAAIRSGWRMADSCADAQEKLEKWYKLIENIYLDTPSPQILAGMSARGWQGNGTIGIAKERLLGWLWLEQGQEPRFKVTGPKTAVISAVVKRLGATSERILYSISAELPEQMCYISVGDSSGRDANGSPLAISPRNSVKAATKKDRATVIIPAYGDRQATLACIGSVLASQKKNSERFELLIAWDNGPDKRLLQDLRRLAARKKLVLIENSANLGFIANINNALARSRGDAILLNADTLVHGDWVDRMLAAASEKDVATVTALGNEAELMSFPSMSSRGKISKLSEVAVYDESARRLGANARLEIPVGVGFCMLITRKAINSIGGLDGRQLCRGYGEEVDFCLRAKEAGLKNYGLFNLFIGHIGGRSFGGTKQALAAQNNEIIFKRFPGYRRDYEIFLARRDADRLREKITAGLLGGLEKIDTLELRSWPQRYLPPWTRDEASKADVRKGAALFLKPGSKPEALLRVWAELELTDLRFNLPQDQAAFSQALADLGIARVVDYSGSGKIRAAARALCDREVAESLPGQLPLYQGGAEKVMLAAPPVSLTGLKNLRALAQARPETIFYVFRLGNIWKGAPLPGNMVALPDLLDYRTLGPEVFLLADGLADAGAWREWLDLHGCCDLEIKRLDRV